MDATSFTLASGSGVAGSVSFDGATNIASFAATSTLRPITTYTATLSTAITDLAGNALAAPHNWSFTTADGAWATAELIEANAGNALGPADRS